MDARLTQDGISTSPWYTTETSYYNSKYNMFTNNGNCLHYAVGRVQEISQQKMPTFRGNAIDVASQPFLNKIDKPTFGAIAVWGGTYYGHVGVVEHVYDDGTILISESNYCGTLFNTAILSSNNNYSNCGMYLVGFYMYDGVTKAIEEEQNKIKAEKEAKKKEVQQMLEQQMIDMGYKPVIQYLLPNLSYSTDGMVLAGTIGIHCYKNIIKNTKIVDMVNNVCYIIHELGKHYTFKWA